MHAPFEVAVHDGEEDLEEQVDGIDEHGEQVQPRFSRHGAGGGSGWRTREEGGRKGGRGRRRRGERARDKAGKLFLGVRQREL